MSQALREHAKFHSALSLPRANRGRVRPVSIVKTPPREQLTRSELMSRVRKKDTAPEVQLRRALWAKGVRFRLNIRLPGSPDIVIVGRRIAIFVDGCFWHGCPDHYRSPKTNTAFWDEKIRKNRARDVRIDQQLADEGWNVVRVWGHDVSRALDRIVEDLVARCRSNLGMLRVSKRTGVTKEPWRE